MIYIIRHGETDLNKERRMQGRNGYPLNKNGIIQAENLRTKLQGIEFDLVYSSPQERAVETAQIVSGGNVIVDKRLDVFELGEADNLKISEVKMDGFIPDVSVYKGIEDTESFVNRVFNFMRELEHQYVESKVNILISGHRCTTGCMGAYYEGIPEDRNILTYSSDNGDYKVYQF